MIKTFSEGELLSRLPFMNIAGGGLFYSVEKELPSVGFRAVNEGYKQSYGVVDPQSEAVHLFGGDVDVDRSIVDLEAGIVRMGHKGRIARRRNQGGKGQGPAQRAWPDP